MSNHGGKRVGAGRKPGSTTKFQREQVQKAKEGGLMPLDFMLQVLRDKSLTYSERLDAAKSAAPYVHSKMPMALVPPANPAPETGQDDDMVLKLYLSGLHAEADED